MERTDPGGSRALPGAARGDEARKNVARLREVFPEVFSGGKIDFDALRETLGEHVVGREERYGFTWHGKSRARRLARTPSRGRLLSCPGESVRWDSTRNLFIEGENLEVLKLLQASCRGRVKMVYIDPPYNTGRDFIYPDRYRDTVDDYLRYTGQVDSRRSGPRANAETAGRYHTGWLNMMYPRLELARDLLRGDGIIFVSIDDHEVHNLRHLMDEVFGRENFIATIIWQKVFSPKNSARHFSEDHDYIVVYARSSETWRPELLPRTEAMEARYSNPDDDPRGPWTSSDLCARNFYGEGTYPVTCPSGRAIAGPPSGRYWSVSKARLDALDEDHRIWWGSDGNNMPRLKRFLSEVSRGRVPQTLWRYQEVGHTQEAKKELLRRVEFASSDWVFDTPKPTRLIQKMLRIGTRANEDDLVLDFFAGSGTTGDAVMQLNAEDSGNRRFILVQLSDPTGAPDYGTIAEIAKARLRATSKALEDAGAAAEGDAAGAGGVDLGFRVLKLAGRGQAGAKKRKSLTKR